METELATLDPRTVDYIMAARRATREADIPLAEELITHINDGLQYLVSNEQHKEYVPRSIWASAVGHPCLAYGYLGFLYYDYRQPLPEHVIRRMMEGKYQEETVKQLLAKVGLTIAEQQASISIDLNTSSRLKLAGKIDLSVGMHPHRDLVPCEIKSMDKEIYPTINTVEDLEKIWYYKKYLGQMYAYLLDRYLKKEIIPEYLLMIIKNKSAVDLKMIPVFFSLEKCEEVWHRAEVLADHIENQVFPEPVNDPSICSWCDYAHVCPHILPAQKDGKRIALTDNMKIQIRKWLGLKEEAKKTWLPKQKELDKIEKACKILLQQLDTGDHIVDSSILVKVKEVQRKGYVVNPTTYKTITAQDCG